MREIKEELSRLHLYFNKVIVGLILIFCWGEVKAETKQIAHFKNESKKYPIEVWTIRPGIENLELLDIGEEVYQTFCETMGIEGLEQSQFILKWQPTLEDEGEVETFSRELEFRNFNWKKRNIKKKVFHMFLDGDFQKNKKNREAIIRTCVICLLQAYMLGEEKDTKRKVLREEKLINPPFWLSEGLVQLMLKDRHPSLNEIIWRFYRTDRVPSLAFIQGWNELSEDPIIQYWQQAYCYWLLKKASENPVDKKAILLWLRKGKTGSLKPYWRATESNQIWWKRANRKVEKLRIPIYSWDQTASRLREALHFKVQLEEGKPIILSVTDLPLNRKHFKKLKAKNISEMAFKNLKEVELTGHVMLKPVAARYREAVTAWSQGKYKEYHMKIRAALEEMKQLRILMTRADNLLKWVYVNYEIKDEKNDFSQYSSILDRLEKERFVLRQN